MSQDSNHSVLIWCDAGCSELVAAVMGQMHDTQVAALAGPSRSAIAPLAERLDAKPGDDLRRLIIDHPAQELLLATTADVTPTDIRAAREAGLSLIGFSPLDGACSDAAETPVTGGGYSLLPLLSRTPAWDGAKEQLDAIGRLRVIEVACLGRSEQGPLHTRLFDAMEMLLQLAGMPLSIDAAWSGNPSGSVEWPDILSGHLSAHLRLQPGMAAIVHASDAAARWSRRLRLHGETGQITLTDYGMEMLDSAGRSLDERTPAAEELDADPASIIVQQWRRLRSRNQVVRSQPYRKVLSCCKAALLSSRTGQLESPSKILEMAAV